MSPKNTKKNNGKIKVPTDTPTESELGNTAADIQTRWKGSRGRERRGGRKGTGPRWRRHYKIKNRGQKEMRVRLSWRLQGKQVSHPPNCIERRAG